MKKIMITSFLTLLPVSHSFADVHDQLRHCADITNSASRLTCFDNIVVELPTSQSVAIIEQKADKPVELITPIQSKTTDKPVALVVEETPKAHKSALKTVSPNQQTIEQNFGLEHRITEQEEKVQAVVATITKAKKSLHGYWTLTLDNQQQWKTTSSQRTRFKVGQQVEVKRGLLNSFSVSLVGSNKTMKVKRVK